MKAVDFFNQTTNELVDTAQRWSQAVNPDTGEAVAGKETDVQDFDEFMIDAADNGALRFPEGSQWEVTSDALLRIGVGASEPVLAEGRKHTLGMVNEWLQSRPLAPLASWFKPIAA